MATPKELAAYVMEQLSELEEIRNIPMMGGYIFYYRERIFGGIYGGGFMVKITEASRKYMPDSIAEPPYGGVSVLAEFAFPDGDDGPGEGVEALGVEFVAGDVAGYLVFPEAGVRLGFDVLASHGLPASGHRLGGRANSGCKRYGNFLPREEKLFPSGGSAFHGHSAGWKAAHKTVPQT